ncbi:5-enolpyruvylshikimate-3-phosphate synthase [hydrocarbon metagenome]|uniref:3-phosphoshikimate 1-carboxyvinyltransferase n=1 Tax=hydrocarbon metagenome TaxID=938273 RepID=A0A0W8E148_9ZZZZ
MRQISKASGPLRGEITAEADKSISHRAVIFSALARGESVIRNFLLAADTLSSFSCMQQLGVDITREGSLLRVKGPGIDGLQEPVDVLNCGNSGTTMRLLTGLLSARPFFSVLSGDASLNNRPMKRIKNPLSSMGAQITARSQGNFPPLAVNGRNLNGIDYSLPVASAQVKSALLLAALTADGETTITEPHKSRDHTERMLGAMGAQIKQEGLEIKLCPGKDLTPQDFIVPGDISSAAFFMVAAAAVPGSELIIKGVGINPTRSGIIDVLIQMGGNIKIENQQVISGEPVADLIVSGSELKAVEISGDIIPRLIDELPVIAVAMAAASGTSIVHDAQELRVKETDRIKAITSELLKMGVNAEAIEDGFIIEGRSSTIKGAQVNSHGDHRIAMSLAVAALLAEGETSISNPQAVDISFPGFWQELDRLSR